jgi:hypothetical protein
VVKQHVKRLSSALMVILLMGLSVGYSSAQAQNPTSNPLYAPLAMELDIGICAPSAGPFSTNITNPYFPLPVGAVWELSGVANGVKEDLRITVLKKTESVAGITVRVMEERHQEDGELVEVSRNFFVQAPDGTVCYYGEDVDMYEDGQVVSHEGAWRAGVNGALPGILMPANPEVGMTYAQEVAPGVAEDRAEIVSIGKTATVPAGTFRNTLETRETTALEPGSVSVKRYAPGVGLIYDKPVKLDRFTP